MNVVAPHLSLWLHRFQQSSGVYPAFWIDQPWHSPSVGSFVYAGGGGAGGRIAPGLLGGGDGAHSEHQHSRLATEFDAPQLKSFALEGVLL